MLNIVFFARLKEQLDCDKLSLDWQPLIDSITTENKLDCNDETVSVATLKATLIAQHPHWQKALSDDRVLCAVNHQVVSSEHAITDNDEVAFFPPVTGG